jgi:hypothetical protein
MLICFETFHVRQKGVCVVVAVGGMYLMVSSKNTSTVEGPENSVKGNMLVLAGSLLWV